MNIYIVRHGKTVYNNEKRMQGSSNSTLLPESLAAAKSLGEAFAKEDITFDSVYSSDLIRTVHTAEKVLEGMNLDLDVKQVYNIREMDFGSAETKLIDDVWTTVAKNFGYDNAEHLLSNKEANERLNLLHQIEEYNDAESTSEFHARIIKGLDEVVSDAKENDSKNVLIIAHGLTILGLLAQLGWEDLDTRSFDNLSVSLINHSDDYKIKFVNKMYV